jgi:hypothetical protein
LEGNDRRDAAILVVSEFEHRRAVYIQRSPIFGFPDIVTVEIRSAWT